MDLSLFFSVLLVVGAGNALLLNESPGIGMLDGNLEIASAKDKNITLLTGTGNGTVYVNDINIVELLLNAQKAAEDVEKWKRGYLFSLSSEVNRLVNLVDGADGLRKRRDTLQLSDQTELPANSEQESRNNLRILTNRVRLYERKFEAIRNMVDKLKENDCDGNPCENGGTCIDIYEGYRCICPSNWQGPNCTEDVNECEKFVRTDLFGCGNGAACENFPGGYRCNYAFESDDIHGVDESICARFNSPELCGHGTCVASAESGLGYTCMCDQGWTTQSGETACSRDIDECAETQPKCSTKPFVQCINFPGGYKCGDCPAGYTGNGYYCTDIDE